MLRFYAKPCHNIRWVIFYLPLYPFVLTETAYGSIKLFLFDCTGINRLPQ